MTEMLSVVAVEPYFTRVGHNVGYFSNIDDVLKSKTPVEAVISSDRTTVDVANRLSVGNDLLVVKSHGFRYEGSFVKRILMFLSAVMAVIGKVHDKETKILILFAYEPAVVWALLGFLKFRRLLLVDHSCNYPDRPDGTVKSLYKFFSRYFVCRLALRPNVFFVVHSPFHRNRLASVIPAGRDRILEIDYPCTLYPENTRSRRTPGERVVFLPGIWRKDKGIEFFLENFPRDLLLSNYRIVVAGHPQETTRDALLGIAKKRQFAERVEIIGSFQDPEELRMLYDRSTYVVLPYLPHYSGGAGPLKDACGHGCPILASDAAGLGAIVQENGVGLSFQSGDANDFVRKVKEMEEIIRQGKIDSISTNARDYAEKIAWPKFAEKLLSCCIC